MSSSRHSAFAALRRRDFRLLWLGQIVSGELEAGSLAAVIGAPLSVVLGGVGAISGAAIAAVKSKSLMQFEM